MSACKSRSDRLRRAVCAMLASAALSGAAAAQDTAPARVVSVNLCTDQLAMLLAAPGQLVSVSYLASDPLSSSMVAEAAGYPANRGSAEQVFLMRPDLVLAGTYTALASVELLRGLGVTVVQVAPVSSLDGVVGQILAVGDAMGRQDAAREMAAEFRAGLADLRVTGDPVTAAMYYPNGYTTGAGTLTDEVLEWTGFRNVGADAGLTGGGILPLERLVLADPQIIVTSTPYPGASRAEEILAHPALAHLRARAGGARTTDADWVCGTPHLLRAIRQMAGARAAFGASE